MPVFDVRSESPLLDLLFDHGDVGRCLVAPDGTVLRANAEWLRSRGLQLDEVLGANLVDLFPETRDMNLALHARARAGHRVEVPPHPQTVHGRETWWEGSIAPVPMEGGNGLLVTTRAAALTGLRALGTQFDVIEQKQAEEALRQSEARFKALADGTPVLIWSTDASGRVIFANRAYTEFFGTSQEEVARNGWVELVHPDDAPGGVSAFMAALANKTPFRGEARVRRADGEWRWIESFSEPRLDPAGNLVSVTGSSTDITDRKRAELLAKESEGRVSAHLDNSPLAIVEFDPQLRVTRWSEQAERLFGWRSDEILGRAIPEIRWVHEDDVEAVAREAAGLLTGARPRSLHVNRNYRKDGTVVVCEWYNSAIYDGDGRLRSILSQVLDVTDRRRAEEALSQSEQRLRALADSIPQLAWTARPDGYVTWYNRRWYDYTGTTPEQMEGWGWQSVHDPAKLPEVLHRWNGALATGTALEAELPLRGADGQFRRFLTRVVPLKDQDGSVLQWFGTNTDVTELLEAQDSLRQASRRKDEFLGMLSHELRNPLAPIRSSAYILRHATPGSDQARRAQGVIERQTEHLTRLVDDLLDVTRIARGKIELRRAGVDLRELVMRAAEDFRLLFEDRGVTFKTVVPDATTPAEVDATRVTQVVGNLLHNAAKFTRRLDEVVLSLAAVGAAAEIRVRDTGAGIDPTLLPRIFEMFVQGERTLARTEGGLGLGLALVKGITELHGGTVHAESAGIDKGSEFIVRLPLGAIARDAPQAGAARHQIRRRVLIVDDNEDAADSLADIVGMLGHAVEVAYDGSTAVDKVRAAPPDVVLCDVGLPGMTGYEVATRLRAMDLRGLQLFAISGYAQPEDVQRALEAGFDGHVAKPCDPEQLTRLLE